MDTGNMKAWEIVIRSLWTARSQRYFEIWLRHPKTFLTICHMPYFPKITEIGSMGSIFRHPFTTGKLNSNCKAIIMCKTSRLFFWYPTWPFCAKGAKVAAISSTSPGFWTYCQNKITRSLVYTDCAGSKNYYIWFQRSRAIQTICYMPIFPNFGQNGQFAVIMRPYAPPGHSDCKNGVWLWRKIVRRIFWYPSWPCCGHSDSSDMLHANVRQFWP